MGLANITGVCGDVVQSSDTLKVMIPSLRGRHMRLKMVRAGIMSYRSNGVVTAAHVAEGDMRVRNTGARPNRCAAGSVWGDVYNFAILGVMGRRCSLRATKEKDDGT
jgi:hypothetical protein